MSNSPDSHTAWLYNKSSPTAGLLAKSLPTFDRVDVRPPPAVPFSLLDPWGEDAMLPIIMLSMGVELLSS